jgi:putative Ca2+/H+ antiporter (TMEM165/GDT1 family)
MEWKVLATAFSLIFLAELGDKTQLAVLALAAKERTFAPILVGATAAFALATAIAVAVGLVGGRYVPTEWVERVAAVAFIAVGVLILLNKI